MDGDVQWRMEKILLSVVGEWPLYGISMLESACNDDDCINNILCSFLDVRNPVAKKKMSVSGVCIYLFKKLHSSRSYIIILRIAHTTSM